MTKDDLIFKYGRCCYTCLYLSSNSKDESSVNAMFYCDIENDGEMTVNSTLKRDCNKWEIVAERSINEIPWIKI